MPKTEPKFKWIVPWKWSRRARQLRIGKLIDAYIFPADGGGYYVKINDCTLGLTRKKPTLIFKSLPEAKQAAETYITGMITRAYRQVTR